MARNSRVRRQVGLPLDERRPIISPCLKVNAEGVIGNLIPAVSHDLGETLRKLDLLAEAYGIAKNHDARWLLLLVQVCRDYVPGF